MKTILSVLFLVLLQLTTTYAQPTYATNSYGGLVLLSNRIGIVSVVTNTTLSTNLTLGDSITLKWKNSKFTLFDWVGLYPVGADNGKFIERKFMTAKEQEVTFAPQEPGTYELRYVRGNGLTQATFGPLVVTASPELRLTIRRTSKNVGVISWPTRDGRTYTVYIGFTLEKDWEPMVVIAGTGGMASVPIPTLGSELFLKVAETETQ